VGGGKSEAGTECGKDRMRQGQSEAVTKVGRCSAGWGQSSSDGAHSLLAHGRTQPAAGSCQLR
jgi:hypothetical protein